MSGRKSYNDTERDFEREILELRRCKRRKKKTGKS